MRIKGLTIKVVALLLLADAIQFAIMLSIKKLAFILTGVGLENISLAGLWGVTLALTASPYFWLGAAGMVASFIVWMTVLSSIDLSIAFPLGSLSFILIPVLSVIFLGEEVPGMRWIGIAFIIGGIIMLSISEKEGEAAK